ncbi:LysR family transcriptional regulator [Comamonas testosteroni]|jgi:DNA-binding transcriptional LysR family regulator|uniref:LysR family transcriptional regulator n=1 Tax=Comamonas testosteroni TaxID=285 RepID=A0A096GLJ2_COMTE|nr:MULTISPECIES: LysR family transcriptional regulator [Comamonas]KGH26020.1 LysR family transcriptional regulator [Comamonas testosteroni]KOC19504.1 LysR family transcriptional regulator [Comamonas testosteroni]KWT71807.1 LysR family transcriptional regulator [Comamonas testosteroni]MDN5503607.1 LysR family transcriptional regulator [Comamonas sp.]MPT11901.1 LysR family transcriptional regulator [Comamonas sp.]
MPFSADQVPLFLAVLDAGSFSAAARKLGRVPSAVSMAIAQLEAELDLQLFDRSGREPVPSAAARALEPQARLLAEQLQLLNWQAQALHAGLEERLTLAIAPELLATHWSEPLNRLVHEFPALPIEVLAAPQADALELLHAGRAHLALVFERPAMDGREGFQEMGRETLVAVMSPQFELWQQALAEHEQGRTTRPQLTVEQLAATRQVLVASRDPQQTDPRFVFARQLWRTDSHQAALSLIGAGLAWGWLPKGLVESHIGSGALMEIPVLNISNGTTLFVDWVWSKERAQGLAARRFVQLLRER